MTAHFADAYYFLALLNPRDEGHTAAVKFTGSCPVGVLTRARTLVDVAHACARQPARSAFLSLPADMEHDPRVYIVSPNDEQFSRGKELFERRKDKDGSLTDCISFVVMDERGLSDALTADLHFGQAGFPALLR